MRFKELFLTIFHKKTSNDKYEKYKNSGLSNDLVVELEEKLKHLMLTEKMYTDSELTLEKLSKELETNKHNTSQIINQFYRKNYSDFINDFRIDDAKKIILESKNININNLIFDLGFNSRSNFYRAFKKRTNLSPSQYKQKHSLSIPIS